MKIQNNAGVTAYMGYAEVGFTLQPGEISHELPESLADNPFLIQDAADGRIAIIGKSPEIAKAIEAVKTKAIPAPIPAIPAPGLDIIENDIQAMLIRISSKEDKIAYLNGLKKDGNGRAIKLANKLLKQYDVSPAAETPVNPAPKLNPQQPVSNVETSVEDKSAQVSIGREGQQPYAPEKVNEAQDDIAGLSVPALLSMVIRMGLNKDYNTQSPNHKKEVLQKLIRDHRAKDKTADSTEA